MALSRKERIEWEKNLRKKRIIDCAEEVFFQKGYESATIDDIAAAAGYSKRSIYLYFRDREELFLAVTERGQELFYSALSTAVETKKADESRLMILGKAFYHFSLSHPEYFSMIMSYESRIHPYRDRNTTDDADSPRTRCRKLSDRYGQLVVDAIEKEIESGKLITTLEPRQMMLLLWGQVFGVMQIILMRKEGFRETYGITPDDLFNEFLAMTAKALSS